MLMRLTTLNKKTHFIDLILISNLFNFLLQPLFQINKKTFFFFIKSFWRLFVSFHFSFNFLKDLYYLIITKIVFLKFIWLIPSMCKFLFLCKSWVSIILVRLNLDKSLVLFILWLSWTICFCSWLTITWFSVEIGSIFFTLFFFLFSWDKYHLSSYSFCCHFWVNSLNIYSFIHSLIDCFKAKVGGLHNIFCILFDACLWIFQFPRRLWSCRGSNKIINTSALK